MLKDKSNSKYKSKEDCGDMNGNVIHDDIVAIHSYILFQSIIDYESKNSRLNNRSIRKFSLTNLRMQLAIESN